VSEIRSLVNSPKTDPAELQTLGALLYKDLLAPAFDDLEEEVIEVVPHGPLHYLPFAAVHSGLSISLIFTRRSWCPAQRF